MKTLLPIVLLVNTLGILFSCRREGCTDPMATNFDPGAKISDNSCTYPIGYCTEIEDQRDGTTYPAIKIGDQCWIAQNLNHEAPSSWCYDDSAAHCAGYGRLYRWEKALEVCPEGSHLPSLSEWLELFDQFGGTDTAGNALMHGGSSGFDILSSGMNQWLGPSQYKYAFKNLNVAGYYWTATEDLQSTSAYYIWFSESTRKASVAVGGEANGYACRCIKD